jgi:hypothetical protein
MAGLRIALALCCVATLPALAAGRGDAAPTPAHPRPDKSLQRVYQKQVLPVLQEYCYGCHGNGKKKGDLALDAYTTVQQIVDDRKTWELVLKNMRQHIMPPETKPQPTNPERERVAEWIEAQIFHCDCSRPDPGRVTLRRLNRAEYNNTIRDLVGVDFQPAEDFPADDTGYGFDNNGDVLSLSPVLLEKYYAAAERIFDAALVTGDRNRIPVKHWDAEALQARGQTDSRDANAVALTREGHLFAHYAFPRDGQYILRARAYGEQAGPEPPKLKLMLEGAELGVFPVPVTVGNSKVYSVRTNITAGKRQVAAAYINNYVNLQTRDPKLRGDRNLVLETLEVEGPLDGGPLPLPETHRRVFFRPPATPAEQLPCAREIVGRFASRAYRRPVTTQELDRLLRFVEASLQQKDSFENSVRVALQAVLVSPHFLFRGELQASPNDPHVLAPLDDFALASRLSYFLWSTMPDEELFALARKKTLRRQLEAQVRRMLKDPRAKALAENFGGQWLQLRNIRIATPDAKAFPKFDEKLRDAMETETEMFFEAVLREDRSVLEFLDADYTYLNERLADHYGIPDVKGDEFRRVSLQGNPRRGGILTHASILTLTSNPTRTSPVKRGKYILENILGTPPPPPPPDVPDLKEDKQARLSGSLRQRMEQHRKDPNCASCHERMDPIGFGFEHYDGIGAWRESDGTFDIDASGKLVSGETFDGADALQAVLLRSKRDEFSRNIAEKMLTYALGRGPEYFDKCALEQITKALAKNRYRFSVLVTEIVKSVPFQMRRGEGERLAQAQ